MLSEDRQSHFAHVIVDKVWDDDMVDYTDEDLAVKVAHRAIAKLMDEFADIDEKAKDTVASLKRNVPEGSPEWDILYNKYFEEELRKRGH